MLAGALVEFSRRDVREDEAELREVLGEVFWGPFREVPPDAGLFALHQNAEGHSLGLRISQPVRGELVRERHLVLFINFSPNLTGLKSESVTGFIPESWPD